MAIPTKSDRSGSGVRETPNTSVIDGNNLTSTILPRPIIIDLSLPRRATKRRPDFLKFHHPSEAMIDEGFLRE